MGKPRDYWIECVAQSLEEHGVAATAEQVAAIASDVEGGHENYGMAHGHDAIPDPRDAELRTVARQLEVERGKRTCEACGGSGRVVSRGGTFQSDSQCHKCRGEGRVSR